MNPSIPPYVHCTVGDFPEIPFGPFKVAESASWRAPPIGRARSSCAPSSIIPKPSERTAHRWGYPAAAGKIEMHPRHDRVETMVYAEGRLILHGEMRQREIVAGVDLQFISSMHLVRNRADGKTVLMQVDPEYAVTQAERGASNIILVDPQPGTRKRPGADQSNDRDPGFLRRDPAADPLRLRSGAPGQRRHNQGGRPRSN